MDLDSKEEEEQMEVGITPSPNIPEEEEEALLVFSHREEGGNVNPPGRSKQRRRRLSGSARKRLSKLIKSGIPYKTALSTVLKECENKEGGGSIRLRSTSSAPTARDETSPEANLHHAGDASYVLSWRSAMQRLDFALIQEPSISNEGRIPGLGNCPGYCTQDVVAVQITVPEETSRGDIVICSAYFPGETGQEAPPAAVRDLITYCRRNNKQLVLGYEANAHHMDWGSSDISIRGWTLGRAVFIQNAGRVDTSLPNSFRPICLTSFFLKTLERIVDKHIREGPLRVIPFSPHQYAYTAGKSTDHALYNLVDKIDHSLNSKEFALGVFLDIERAFNNALPYSIQVALVKRCVERWGAFSSPVNCLGDDLLEELCVLGVDVLWYAYDLAILIRGKYEDTISDLLRQALNIIDSWCRREQMSINSHKTVVVPLTKDGN
nr:unnamed protein product [Callosobruchus analis]